MRRTCRLPDRRAQPRPGAILGRSMRRQSPWLRCLRSRRPDDPNDGAKRDHFSSGGAGDGAGEGAGLAFSAAAPFAMDCAPTNAKTVPAFSAVTSRQFGGNTSGGRGGVARLRLLVDHGRPIILLTRLRRLNQYFKL